MAAIGACAAVPLAIVGHGFVNYDSFYALVWGNDLANGRLPQYRVPIAPTPKPLDNVLGLLLSPLGHGAQTARVILAFVLLGVLGFLVYRLGADWFGRAAGMLATAIVLTREPVLSFGVRGYVDIAYLVLVLGALLMVGRGRQAGPWPIALLALAGLLRPEAWLLSAAYLAYVAPRVERPALLRLALLAAAGPALWLGADLVVTGDPLYSLTGTRQTAELLGRRTGLLQVPLTAPRRIGEILREPVLIGAIGGLLLTLVLLRERARLGVAAGSVAIAAFCVLALAGMPILGRYLLLPATLLAIFCGAGAFGWARLDRGHPARRHWQAFGTLVLVLLTVFIPAQAQRLTRLRHSIAAQEAIVDDLHRIADSKVLAPSCRPVAVPNHRAVPLLALWLDRPPRQIVSAQLKRPRTGYFLAPASPAVASRFILDPRDPKRLDARIRANFQLVSAGRSWRVYARCPHVGSFLPRATTQGGPIVSRPGRRRR